MSPFREVQSPAFAAIVSAACLLVAPASATKVPEEGYGAVGGAPYDVICAPDSYLTGFSGRAGAWIDQMAIVCSPWRAREKRLGEPAALADQMIGRSAGGEEISANCPAGWIISGPYTPRFSDWDDGVLVHSIEFNCTPPEIEPAQRVPRAFGSSSPLANMYRRWPGQPETACPSGEFATGIHGRSGLFVDSFGLICGPPPDAVLCAAGRLVCGVPVKPKKPEPMVETKKPSDLIRKVP